MRPSTTTSTLSVNVSGAIPRYTTGKVFAPTWISLNRARHDPRANLHADIAKGRIRGKLGRELGRCQIVDARLPDGARHQVADRAEDQDAAEQKLRSRFHVRQSVGRDI